MFATSPGPLTGSVQLKMMMTVPGMPTLDMSRQFPESAVMPVAETPVAVTTVGS